MTWVTFMRRFGKACRFSARQWADLIRACIELGRARIILYRTDPRSLVRIQDSDLIDVTSGLVDRVAFAIPAAGGVVPWRSDCLVQALAAQRWLAKAGIPTKLHLGVTKSDGFLAHAWLTHGTRVITGGDVSQFSSFGHLE